MIRDNKTSYLLMWDKVLFNYLIYPLYFNNNEHINKNKGGKKKLEQIVPILLQRQK